MLTIQEIVLIFALIGVLGGWAVGRVGAWIGNRRAPVGAKDAEAAHRGRALEAELRVYQRKAEESELALEREREVVVGLKAELVKAHETLAGHDGELAKLRRSLSEECNKTQALRQELTDRAEETIRASVRVKDAETELGVARAGSDAVLEQVQALAAEREELTNRLRALQSELSSRGITPKVTPFPARGPRER